MTTALVIGCFAVAIGIGWWVERDTPPRDPEQEADQ